MSAIDDPAVVRATLRSGAWAYVLKDAQPKDIAVAVRQAFSQSIYLGGTLDFTGAANSTVAPKANGSGLSVLTRSVLEVLALVTDRPGHLCYLEKGEDRPILRLGSPSPRLGLESTRSPRDEARFEA